jgi:hypothetical protein
MAVGVSQEETPGRADATLEIPAKLMRGSIRVIPEKERTIGIPQGEEEARRGTRTRDGVARLSATKL